VWIVGIVRVVRVARVVRTVRIVTGIARVEVLRLRLQWVIAVIQRKRDLACQPGSSRGSAKGFFFNSCAELFRGVVVLKFGVCHIINQHLSDQHLGII
jgi:hypothetical protein